MSETRPARATWRPGPDGVALAVLSLLAVALRLYRLGAQCFWFDEAQTLFVARFPWAEIVQRAYRPPLYHFLLHIWSALVPNNEFWLRLPSALLGTAVPPLLYAAAGRLYGRRAAWAAGLLAVFSPTLIAYAQELRMYSLMAAEFALLLYLLTRLLRRGFAPRLGLWLAIGLVTIAGLYTHYFALPFLLCVAALAAVTLAAQGRRADLGRWAALEGAVAIAYIPWLLVILGGRGGAEDYIVAEVLPVLPEVSGVGDFMSQAWLFYTTGPVTSELALVRPLAWAAALALGAAVCVLAVGVLASLVRWRRLGRQACPDAQRVADLWLLTLTLAPWAAAALMYHLRPGVVHPRHLMMLAVPLLLVAGRAAGWGLALLAPSGPRRRGDLLRGLLGALSALLLAGVFLLSYAQSLRDPALQRAEVRAMAQQVIARTDAETVVLLPYQDYAFEHYFGEAAALYHLETRVGDADLLPWLLPRIQGARRAVLIEWVHMHQDPRDLLPWFLQRNGRLVERFWSAERWVSVYDLEPTLADPRLEAAELRVGPLTLTGIALPATSPADQALPVALQWRLDEATARDLKVSVRLADASGHVWAMDDRVLLGEQTTLATSRWRPGEAARSYYLLALPVGTPPVEYDVQISVYDAEGALAFSAPDGGVLGTVVTVGRLSIAPPESFAEGFSPETPLTPVSVEMAPRLELVGSALDRETARPGETLAVTLYWRSLMDGLPDFDVQLAVVGSDGALVTIQHGRPAQGGYPTSRWRAGELVVDRHLVRIAPEAEAGPAQIVLTLGEQSLALAELQIEAADRLMALPDVPHAMDVPLGGVARLAGVAVEPETASAGGPLAVTLYWEALSGSPPESDYVVFVHLVGPDERIIAQHDGAPDGGTWPTSAWVPGQVIVDRHELVFGDLQYRGPATLAIGLYDPITLQRLATPAGVDRIVPPIAITIE